MRWREGRRSTNVEDRRMSGPRIAVGGGIGVILIAVVVALLGGDPSQILGGAGGGGPQAPLSAEDRELGDFVSAVLADTEDVWKDLFQRMGRTYEDPKLVLFRGAVDTSCGRAGSSVGPFYCPPDRTVYIDLAFYDDLKQRFGAPGDFAQAYVIAHEVGHHVQNLLGISDQVHAAQESGGKVQANALSVRLELQADFLAGVWAHHAQKMRNILEEGDVEEALRAASAIGDDRIQRQTQGQVVPDSFTHGTSAQRVAWFRHGLVTGDLAKGDAFDDRVFASVNPR